MKTAEEILREYCEFVDVNGSDEIHLLPLTITDAMDEYADIKVKEFKDGWISVDSMPKEYGRYLVSRNGKIHFETFNTTGWAYNHNSITHWKSINPPKEK